LETAYKEGRSRILIHPPSHPLLSIIYTLGAIVISGTIVVLLGGTLYLLPLSARLEVLTAMMLFTLSPALSYVNIIIKEVETGPEQPVLELEYASVFGIPVPIPRIVFARRKIIIAVNVGGAIVPSLASILFLSAASHYWGAQDVITPFLVDLVVVSIVTYATSRVIPGVGIAVPALIPPLTSATLATLLAGGAGLRAGFIAYAAGSLGSLIGADILRLLRDLEKMAAGIASIGGVGVFDGIFLSGALALVLAL